jgi:hypothetical protein
MTTNEKRLILALHEIRYAAVDREHSEGERLGIIDVLAFEGLRDTGGLDWWAQQECGAQRALQALLPGARMAEDVGPVRYDAAPVPGVAVMAYVGERVVGGGQLVAILATQAREEVEDAEDTETPAG